MRAALLLVSLAARAVPSARRREFLAQWGAELIHYAQWLERDGERHRRRRLFARASGAVPHALEMRILSWSPRMIGHDLKFAWRLFVRRPAFTAVAVLVLALGIGANTTIFSWMQTVLFSPLGGVPRQDRLLAVNGTSRTRTNLSTSYPNFLDLRAARPDAVADVMAFRLVAINLRADGEPVRAFGELVTPNFFDVLGVTPSLGRGFRPEEGSVPGRDPVAVISDALWRRTFSADPRAIGRTVSLNGQAFTIIGVTPPAFHGSSAALRLDVFVPMTMQPAVMSGADRLAQRGNSWMEVYARIADGRSAAEANAGIAVAAKRLADAYPEINKDRGMRAVPLWRAGAGNLLFPVFGILMAMVGLVLVIACANVAGLLLIRAAGRQREIAVRLAVGASRARVVRQLLIESLLLSVAGCAAGIVAAQWASGLLNLFVPRTTYPVVFEGGLHPKSLIFAMVLSIASATVAGLVPALRASRPDVGVTLKAVSATGTPRRGRLRQSLVAAQLALCLVLLVAASLFARSVTRAGAMDPGFALRDGILASVDLLPAGYDEARGTVLFEQLTARVSSLPHVVSASVARSIPLDLSSGSDMGINVDGYTPRDGEEVQSSYNQVGTGYFETMGIPIVRGRAFDTRDRRGAARAAIVNETMARRYWPGRDAVGGTIRYGSGPVTIVGVAKDGKYQRLNEEPRNYLYLPLAQNYRPDMVLHVRTDTDPATVMPSIRAAVRALDANLPLFDERTVEDHLQISTFIARLAASLLGFFGLLGLLLATVGLYGVVGFNAAQRMREIGLRVALGADRGQVIGLILRDAAVVVGVGIGAGLVLSYAAGRLVASQLTGVSGADPVSFAATAALLAFVAASACALPAWRAATMNPLTALRAD
jgi:predicted permease